MRAIFLSSIFLSSILCHRLAEVEKLGREIPTAPSEHMASSEPTAPSKPVKPRGTDPRSQLLAGAVLLMTFEPDTFTSQDGKLRVANLAR